MPSAPSMEFDALPQSNENGEQALADSPDSEPVPEEEASISARKVQDMLNGTMSTLNRQVDVVKIGRTARAGAFGWLSQGLIIFLHHRYVDCIDVRDERMLLDNNRWRLLWGVLGPLVAGFGWWWLMEKRVMAQQGQTQTTRTFEGLSLKRKGLEDRRYEGQGWGYGGIPGDKRRKSEAASGSQNEHNDGQNAFEERRKSLPASLSTASIAQCKRHAGQVQSMKDEYEEREKQLKAAHALELDRPKTEIQSLKQKHEEQLQIAAAEYDKEVDDLKQDFVREASIINGKNLFIMARFKSVSDEQECAIYDVDVKGGIIEAKNNDGSETTTGELFRGFSGIITRDGDNTDVWRLLHPGFLAFTCRHPVCFLFDGYSGSGKSYTMFNGPEPIVDSLTRELFEWKERMHCHNQSVTIAFEAVIVELHHSPTSTANFPDIRTVDELGKAIQSVRQTRDKKNRPTNNNNSSSRSHLVMRFKAARSDGSARNPVKPWSSLCLVDLAGNERTEDPKEGKMLTEEKNERNFINKTRSDLQGMLIDPINPSFKGKLTKPLLDYIFSDKNENEAQKKQRGQREPKVFILSLLSPTVASRQMTINTLGFTQELIEARGGGGGAAARPGKGTSKPQPQPPTESPSGNRGKSPAGSKSPGGHRLARGGSWR